MNFLPQLLKMIQVFNYLIINKFITNCSSLAISRSVEHEFAKELNTKGYLSILIFYSPSISGFWIYFLKSLTSAK